MQEGLYARSVKLTVTDSISGERLPIASVIREKQSVIFTDDKGEINLPVNINQSITINYLGYQPKKINITSEISDTIIRMNPMDIELSEVTIKPRKEKYSKRNNPAVDLMHLIRQAYKNQNPKNEDYYSYDKYEKTIIGLNDFDINKSTNNKIIKKDFLKNYHDTSSWTGLGILDLSIKEKFTNEIYRKNPHSQKEIVRGYRSAGIDEAFEQENIRVILEDMVREVNIFDESITILQNRFVGPFSTIGPDFYKYYIADTVYVGKDKCLELDFVPRNDKSMGFNGKIYVKINDSVPALKKINIRTPHDINLNFVNNLFINQNFETDSLNNLNKTYDDVCIEMQIIPGTPEFYGRKTTVYDNFSYKKHDELTEFYDRLGESFEVKDTIMSEADFWNQKRMIPLTGAETNLIYFRKEMKKIPLLYWGEKIVKLFAQGYIGTGNPSKFDFGPLNTFLSFNSIEGVRLRVGGMTMSALSPHFFAKGYVAYGTKDRRWKYGGELEYSFAPKKLHSYEWPRHGFYARYYYDIDMIGQHYLFTNQDNIFLSLKREEDPYATYRRLANIGYVLELPNHFSVEVGLKWERQESTEYLPFIYSNGIRDLFYNQSAFNISLRWAKGEKFVQGRSTRLPVNLDAWILQLTHEFGPKNLLGASFTMNKTEFSVQKRFWFSAFGYTDMILKLGKIWSSVFYPALLWQNANLSYTIQPESYSLLVPMEFAMDSYASIDLVYFGNGVLFNRIPFINKLKLREAVTFKGFMGDLSKKNNPMYNENLYQFPINLHTGKINKIPYMEIGVGIDNILRILRVDYVWRLTYRDVRARDRSGVRISLHFSF